tara:strand:+ start:369 stop:551 length:183 start_codon:yes stop_codon:yes gene_type:complete
VVVFILVTTTNALVVMVEQTLEAVAVLLEDGKHLLEVVVLELSSLGIWFRRLLCHILQKY